MKEKFVKDIQKNDQFSGEQFVVSELKRNVTKTGDEYIRIELGDKTGTISGNIWKDKLSNCEEDALNPGVIVNVYGRVEEYKGALQMNIISLGKAKEYVIDNFVLTTDKDIEKMWSEFLNHIESIENDDIRNLMKKIFDDKEFADQFKVHPAAELLHHNFQGGLLEHTLELLDMAEVIFRYYPEADKSLVKAGAILHDIGKIYELKNNLTTITRTVDGYLLGHLIQGYEFLVKVAPEDFPADLLLKLKHIILAHNGSYEYGSPVLPMTLEAIIVSEVDMTSYKVRHYQRIIRENRETSEDFSNRDFFLGTKVYLG